MESLQVSHHRTHHSTWKSAAYKQRTHMGVIRIDPITKEIIDKLLRKRTHLHIGIHIEVLYLKAVSLEHLTDGDHIRMHLAPRKRLNGNVKIISSGTSYLKHRSRREARAAMTVILDCNMRIFLLYLACKLGEKSRPADAGHILQAYLVASVLHDLVHDTHIIVNGVDGRICDGKSHLRDHPCLLGIFYAETEIAVIVQSTERAGYISALRLLYLIHKLTHISRHRIHAESIETTLKHMGLDTGLMERRRPLAYSLVWILAKEQIDLFERTSVGLDAIKASHFYYCRSYLLQLSDSRHISAGRLPHVSIYKREFNFTSHYAII